MALNKYQLNERAWPFRSRSPRSKHVPQIDAAWDSPAPHHTQLKPLPVFTTILQCMAYFRVSTLFVTKATKMSEGRQMRAGEGASAEPAFAFRVRSTRGTQDPRLSCAAAGVRIASALRGGARAGGRGAPGRRPPRRLCVLTAVLRA